MTINDNRMTKFFRAKISLGQGWIFRKEEAEIVDFVPFPVHSQELPFHHKLRRSDVISISKNINGVFPW